MRIYYSSKFGKEYKKLPHAVKKSAEEKEKIFRDDPFDKRLNTHKLHGRLKDYWAFSVSSKHRIIFEFAGKDTTWFHSVGDHSVYE